MDTLPGCFYSTEVVFVDDSEIYLETLNLFFQGYKDQLTFKTFSDPNKALEYVNSKEEDLAKNFWEPEDTFVSNCYAIKLDVFSLHKKIYTPERFNRISVILADYNLGADKMNGVTFCQKVAHKNVRKLLFTGQTELGMVVDAFNAGQIQRYVPKQDIKELGDVLRIVQQEQDLYFSKLTESLQVALRQKRDFPLAIYSKAFQAYFRNLLEKKHIKEYYLLDAIGSFLLVDKHQNISILVVQNEDQVRANCLELNGDIDDSTFDKLERGKVVFYNVRFWNRDMEDSCAFLPADTVVDEETQAKFYCAHTLPLNWPGLKDAVFLKND